ncbi:MAG: urate hydroxylase PuuD [Alphaproteobacteria bacterium]
MDPLIVDWGGLIIRWLHVITGIAWIGSSFYFIFLDASLRRREGMPDGVAGETWQVHGGGFYHMQKYATAPAELPEELHWFKYEAYFTWISGFSLLVLLYYFSADLFLVDPDILDISPTVAVLIGIASLAGGWIVYDQLCKSPLGRSQATLSTIGFVLLVAAVWGYTQVFSGRGAFIHAGSLIGTIMVANVFFIIIPNQKVIVADLIAGRVPDPNLGLQSKQRSVHNNYLTLPVVFVMVSNHYPMTFESRWNWLILTCVIVVGGVVRHFYNLKHAGKGEQFWLLPIAVAFMLAAVGLSLPPRSKVALEDIPEVSFAEVRRIIDVRCAVCHSKNPTFEGFNRPPAGVIFDDLRDIQRSIPRIRTQAVNSRAMPLGNVTEMTDEERQTLSNWLAHGAPLE